MSRGSVEPGFSLDSNGLPLTPPATHAHVPLTVPTGNIVFNHANEALARAHQATGLLCRQTERFVQRQAEPWLCLVGHNGLQSRLDTIHEQLELLRRSIGES